jgi:acetyl esterase/lipase
LQPFLSPDQFDAGRHRECLSGDSAGAQIAALIADRPRDPLGQWLLKQPRDD